MLSSIHHFFWKFLQGALKIVKTGLRGDKENDIGHSVGLQNFHVDFCV